MPEIKKEDGTNSVKNLFLTIAPGYSQSWRNDLDYPAENTADKTVKWVTLYTALEYRWAQTEDYSKNLFANLGPAYHYIFSDAFENLNRLSVRGRFGVRYHSLSFGGQIDFFTEGLAHERLGVPGDPEVHRIGYGFFVGINIPGLTNGPKHPCPCKKTTSKKPQVKTPRFSTKPLLRERA